MKTSASSMATFSCASVDDAPRWGTPRKFSCWNKGDASGGSLLNTSSAAPASCPDCSAPSSAASSTMPPRAQLMRYEPFFIFASVSALKRLRVPSVSGTCSVTMSDFVMISSSETSLTPAGTSLGGNGS